MSQNSHEPYNASHRLIWGGERAVADTQQRIQPGWTILEADLIGIRLDRFTFRPMILEQFTVTQHPLPRSIGANNYTIVLEKRIAMTNTICLTLSALGVIGLIWSYFGPYRASRQEITRILVMWKNGTDVETKAENARNHLEVLLPVTVLSTFFATFWIVPVVNFLSNL